MALVFLSPVGGVAAQFFTNAGVPLSGGKIYTYAAGTSTPQATYTTNTGNIQHSNPIVLNSAGRVPTGEIWLTDGSLYKFVIYDANDVLIATYDNITGINSNFVNYTNQQEIQTATAGQTVFTLTTMQYQPGTGNLSVFVDGVNQYGPGAPYAFVETSSTVVTFVSGLHVGAEVKFTTSQLQNAFAEDASQITYTYPAANAVQESVEDRLAQYVSIVDFGAIGDSNGTSGNGTDNTTAIQNAVDVANATGKLVYIPVGRYRITGSIDFTGAQTKTGFVGESNFNSIIFADFTSGSSIAALSLNNSAGARAYVAFKNFKLEGLNNANVSGIYTNYGSEFTEFENVFVYKFYNGIVIANDYNVKLTRCQTWYNTNNGIQIGYTLAGAIGAANNITMAGCLSTYNGANGYYVYACRALGISQCDGEANAYTNFFLDSVYGGSMTGIYMEYASSEAGNPVAQLRLRNCIGISVNGVSVSAFDNYSNPVVWVDEGNNGVDLVGLAIESAGSPIAALGVKVYDSFGISIRNSYFNALSAGIYLQHNCRVEVATSNFSNCTYPIITDGTGSKQLVWNDAVGSEVTTSASQIGSETIVDVTTIDNEKNQINLTKAFTVSVAYSDLASAASKNLITHTFVDEQWRIVDIFAVAGTAFSGGDRLLNITDGTKSYSVIPAASLQSSSTQARWGVTAVPYSAIVATMAQPTVAGSNLIAQYAGGATDYTAGAITLTIVAERVA